MARAERFERPTLRFVVWSGALKQLAFVTVSASKNREIAPFRRVTRCSQTLRKGPPIAPGQVEGGNERSDIFRKRRMRNSIAEI